jgi:hypothetical protein
MQIWSPWKRVEVQNGRKEHLNTDKEVLVRDGELAGLDRLHVSVVWRGTCLPHLACR